MTDGSAIDYGRSYLRFRSDRVNHSPRLQLDASCLLRFADGRERRFVLTSPCIGERMYEETGLIHEPPFEFLMVGEHGSEYAIHRKHATADGDAREVHRFGEAMETAGGVPARIQELDVHLTTYGRVEPITTYEGFRDALLGNRPVNGRTTYLAADGATTVVLEYPAKTMNVAHGRALWQVDAGPALVPDLAGPVASGDVLAGRFDVAFLVFNRWDYVEMVAREVVAAGEAGAGAGAGPGAAGALMTTHYGRRRGLAVRNELFCAAV